MLARERAPESVGTRQRGFACGAANRGFDEFGDSRRRNEDAEGSAGPAEEGFDVHSWDVAARGMYTGVLG